ncbi:MAG: hypothetical protein REI95_10495 [Oxalicibacterium faecigallinarum]|uniref:hypothetical protein n=1 Tax=Oxalicibacterium faecigallinarum TaxID=573741 RepID=UPI0028092B02|nr:hypothetical protein [Oxalicibacterium faecigallinarum]MDQ7970062.1 hypothetical protein [Oxalicibacterium faecigallinarum]
MAVAHHSRAKQPFAMDKPVTVTDFSVCYMDRATSNLIKLVWPDHLRGKKRGFLKKSENFFEVTLKFAFCLPLRNTDKRNIFEKNSKIFCLNPKVLQNRAVKETGCGVKEKFFAVRRLFFEKYRW